MPDAVIIDPKELAILNAIDTVRLWINNSTGDESKLLYGELNELRNDLNSFMED